MTNKLSFVNGAKKFSPGKLQNYLVFIPGKKYIKYFTGTTWINSRKSNGASIENIENKSKSDSNLAPSFVDYHILQDINFRRHCLINNKVSIPKKVLNVYIAYTLIQWLRDSNTDFTLGNFLFRSEELSQNTDPDKYK